MYVAFENLKGSSRVWIYQSNRPFNENELFNLERGLKEFAENWTAHDEALKASYKVVYNRFIVLAVDESAAGASGCSIDKSVNFMKVIESEFGVDLFDRMSFAYMDGEEVITLNRSDFEAALAEGKIDQATTVFNNLVATKEEFEKSWSLPLSESWHKNFFLSGQSSL